MFDSLRKKLSGWLGKPEEKKSKKTKLKKEKPVKAKKKKEPRKTKEKTASVQEIKQLQVGEESEEIESEESIKSDPSKISEQEAQLEAEEEEQELKEITGDEKEEKRGFFSKLFKKATSHSLSSEEFEEVFSELEIILLENNVSLEVVDKIKESLGKKLVDKEIKKSEAESLIIESLKESILEVLIEPSDLIKQIKNKQGVFVILFFGINGTGKTTSIAKLAHLLQKEKISCLLAAADTFRAASIEQLQKHADSLKVPIIKQNYGSDPAAVAFDAIQHAKTNNIKVVLIDTAGRMYTKQNLIKEMEKVVRVSKPDLKIFVGESITGNDVIEQAKIFNEAIGLDGSILTKADVDEKAGSILSISYITQKPIYFLGVGQTYNDLEIFKKSTVLKNLGL